MGEQSVIRENGHRFSPAAPGGQYVYGSCSPGWHSAGDHSTCLDQWIEFMQSEGIERVCCLLAGRHLDEQRANLSRYRAEFGPQQVCHSPIPDGTFVDSEQLQTEILPFIEESVREEKPVVVQSLAGICRTGQVLAAWLIYGEGYDPTEAVDTVIETGRDPTATVDHGDATRSELFELLGEIASYARE